MIYILAHRVDMAKLAAQQLGFASKDCKLLPQAPNAVRGRMHKPGDLYVWVLAPGYRLTWQEALGVTETRDILRQHQVPLLEYTLP